MNSFVCLGCLRTFEHRKPNRKYCCVECKGKRLKEWPQSSLRFHKMRAGGWKQLGEAIGVSPERLCLQINKLDVDKLHSGEMVSIGGILAKRCANCGVARMLESFQNDREKKSGVGGHCNICRGVTLDES